jgi:molybdate transport system substrate-binding protein
MVRNALLRGCGFCCAVLLLLGAVRAEAGRVRDAPVVAAAADLQFALAEAAASFTRESGMRLKLSFGSSGNFHRQIRQGGPFELFLSADEKYPLDLAARGLTLDRGELYAVGRIVIMVPHGSPLRADGGLADLRAAIGDGRLRKFAIANPEHAPYGRAAKDALTQAGLWEEVSPSLVLGENASQATQFALRGSTQGGIVPYSLALAPEVARLGQAALIPAEWHAPLRQRMVLLKNAGPAARAFYAYLGQPEARAILRRYGFVLPGEAE